SASKAGLIALTKGLGRELAPQNILANAIAPAVIDTPQLEVDAADAGLSLEQLRERHAPGTPTGRPATAGGPAAPLASAPAAPPRRRPAFHVEPAVAPLEAVQVVAAGAVGVTPFDIDTALTGIENHAADLLGGDRAVLALGGDHTVALPLLRAVRREHGPVAL